MAASFVSKRWLTSISLALGLFTTSAVSVTTSDTILIISPNAAAAANAYSGLQGYGIPYSVLNVPSTGVTLPALNSSATVGNYGGIVVISEVSYDYGGTFASALTAAQWQTLYTYQTTFGVRMVRLDSYPGPDFGATALGGTTVDQPVSFTNTSGFPTANLKTGATVDITGIYHYPATISDNTIAWEVARFSAGGGLPASTAAVINKIGARQQMVWFMPFATDWSQASNYLQHSWIHFVTRGLYNGFRRIYFNTQVDDMFLETDMYIPNGTIFRIRSGDLADHKTWTPQINAKMPSGSNYMIEIGHNGNGDIEAAVNLGGNTCSPNTAIEYPDQIDTALEFQKPLGTGTNIWPSTPATYAWSLACAKLDPLMVWITTPANLNSFMHISHTFSHEALNNATYSDVNKEITFNQAWLSQVGIAGATYFSSKGLIPPAITGLHNGDAINAFMTNGIRYVVGDNTRPVLKNPTNSFWPLISTVAGNGYAGLVIMPRWATTIYYNCDLPACTLQEWKDTSAGSGTFDTLLQDARITNSRNLLGLHWDPFMFHQANLRQTDVPALTINGVSRQYSLLQAWVETVVNEMTRLTDWPMITKKHDDLAVEFVNRMNRDGCAPRLTYNYSTDNTKIVGVTVGANGNSCSTKIPVTFPGPVTSANGQTTEKVGNDPLTIWVSLTGSAMTFNLATPIPV